MSKQYFSIVQVQVLSKGCRVPEHWPQDRKYPRASVPTTLLLLQFHSSGFNFDMLYMCGSDVVNESNIIEVKSMGFRVGNLRYDGSIQIHPISKYSTYKYLNSRTSVPTHTPTLLQLHSSGFHFDMLHWPGCGR